MSAVQEGFAYPGQISNERPGSNAGTRKSLGLLDVSLKVDAKC